MKTEKEQHFVSAVVYVRNNEKTLEHFLTHVYQEMDRLFTGFEIVCVDDASTDRSEAIIRGFAEGRKQAVTLIRMGYVQGAEAGMNAGEDLAIGDFVYEFDKACVTWPEDMMEQVFRKAEEGYDIISACPDGKGRFTSRLFYGIFNRSSHVSTKLRTEAFRLTSRRAINRVSAMNHAQMYKKAMYANAGLKQTFIEYPEKREGKGAEKTARERRRLAFDSLILFTDFGYKVSFWMSLLMLLFAAVVGIYTVIIYATGHPVEGWTPIMVFLAIGFFVLFGILTFVLKYLSLILSLNFRRQRYVVQEIEKL